MSSLLSFVALFYILCFSTARRLVLQVSHRAGKSQNSICLGHGVTLHCIGRSSRTRLSCSYFQDITFRGGFAHHTYIVAWKHSRKQCTSQGHGTIRPSSVRILSKLETPTNYPANYNVHPNRDNVMLQCISRLRLLYLL